MNMYVLTLGVRIIHLIFFKPLDNTLYLLSEEQKNDTEKNIKYNGALINNL